MSRRRTCISALIVVAALAGCGGGPGAPSPTPSPSAAAPTAQTPPATPEPAPLTEAKAARAFAKVEVAAGFRLDLQCPPKTAQDKRICATPTDDAVVWSASRTYLGPDLPGAGGLPATVSLNLTAAKTEAAADALYERRLRGLQARDGSYDIPLKKKSGSYTPGERGRGDLKPRASDGWRGVELRDEFVLVFDTSPSNSNSSSKKLTSRTRVQRRGVYVLDVSWTAAKSTAIANLRDLPDRTATALDQS